MSNRQSLMHMFGDRYCYFNNNDVEPNVQDKLRFEDCRLHDLFYEIALNRFVWRGLPPSVESRHIERGLLERGIVMFTDDETLGLICLPCTGTGNLNIYGEYNNYNLHRLDGGMMNYTVSPYINGEKFLEEDEKGNKIQYGVLCKPSYHDMPFLVHVHYYSAMVEDFELTYAMNLQQQRFTNFIPTTSENEFQVKQMLGKVYDYEPFVLATKKMIDETIKDMKPLNMGVTYLLSNLHEDKQKIISEYLSLCGINNNPMFKKERMISDEVNSNNEYIEFMINREYEVRQKCAKELSDITGRNITVERVKDLLPIHKKLIEQEGEIDG